MGMGDEEGVTRKELDSLIPIRDPKRLLALLRAAERLGITALRWMPFTEEVIGSQRPTLIHDLEAVTNDLDLVRNALAEVSAEVLREAEEAGRGEN